MEKLRVAVVGSGEIGSVHIDNIVKSTTMQLAGIVEVDNSKVVQWHDVGYHVENSLRDLVEHTSIEAVVLCTPEGVRERIIEDAIDAHCAIFLEKPLARTIDEAIKIYDRVASSCCPFQIGFQRRFDPDIVCIHHQTKKLGSIQSVRSITRDPFPPSKEVGRSWGGIAVSTLIHDIDTVQFLCGPIESVFAIRGKGKSKSWQDADNLLVAVEFESGSIGMLEAHWNSGYGYDSRVELFSHGNLLHTSVSATPPNFQTRFKQAYRNELEHFCASIKESKPCWPGLSEALSAQVIVEAVNMSLQTNTSVSKRTVDELHSVPDRK